MEYFNGHYVRTWVHERNPYLSPLAAAGHADLPPATVVTCGFDPLRDEGRAYADALDADGTSVTHREYDDLIHGVVNMVSQPMDVAGGHEILADAAADLRDQLRWPSVVAVVGRANRLFGRIRTIVTNGSLLHLLVATSRDRRNYGLLTPVPR